MELAAVGFSDLIAALESPAGQELLQLTDEAWEAIKPAVVAYLWKQYDAIKGDVMIKELEGVITIHCSFAEPLVVALLGPDPTATTTGISGTIAPAAARSPVISTGTVTPTVVAKTAAEPPIAANLTSAPKAPTRPPDRQ